MIVWFNQIRRKDARRNAISIHRGFQGNIGLFFAVMEKLGHAPFLWWSEILRVSADFERNEVLLSVEGQKKASSCAIPFEDLLRLSYDDLVERHMRPFAAEIARSWDFVRAADVIESGGDREAIEVIVAEECHRIGESPNWYVIALINILYVDAEVPWSDIDFP